MQPRHRFLLAAILTLYGLGIVVFSQCRSLDRDEGYYAAAVRLVAEGKTVYRDFFYPQAPGVPYVYALADRAGGNLASLRLVSAATSILMVLLWSVYLVDRHRNAPRVALLALLLLALDPHLAYWNVTVKTFGLGNLLLTAALVSLYFAVEHGRKLGYAVSGLCSAALISVRLLYAPIAPVLLGWLLLKAIRHREPNDRQRFVPALAYAAGLTLGGLPFLAIFLSDPQAIYFGNFGYHALRAAPPGWPERAVYVVKFLTVNVCDPYLVLGLALALVGFCSKQAADRSGFLRLTVILAAVFALGTATPYPLNAHYFTGTLATFLVPAAALGIATIGRRTAALTAAAVVASGVLLLLGSPFLAKAQERLRDLVDAGRPGPAVTAGRPVSDVGVVRSEKSLASFKAVAQYVRTVTQPGDIVLSFWPGYVYESGRRFFPGLEDDFGLAVSARLSATQRAAYKIASREDILTAIRNRAPKAVVIGGYWMDDLYPGPDSAEQRDVYKALDASYRLGRTLDGIAIYVRRD